MGTFQEEQIDTEELDPAFAAGRWGQGFAEVFAVAQGVAQGIAQGMVEDTAYFLVLRRA